MSKTGKILSLILCLGILYPLLSMSLEGGHRSMMISEHPLEVVAESLATYQPFAGSALPLFITDEGVSEVGTYVIKVTVECNENNNRYSVYIPPSPYPMKIVQNGRVLYEWGDLGESRFLANYRAQLISLSFPQGSTNSEFKVYLFTEGASIAVPLLLGIGDEQTVSRRVFWITLLNHDGIVAIVLTSIILSILLFSFYFIERKMRVDKLLLGFAGMSIAASYIIFVFNADFISGLQLIKIARIGNIFLPLTLFLFIVNYSHFASRKTSLYLLGATIILIGFPISEIIRADSKYLVNMILNQTMKSLLLPLMLLSVTLLVAMVVHRVNRTRSIILLSFYLIFFVATVHDVADLTSFIQPEVWRIPYGFIIVFLGYMFATLYTDQSIRQELHSKKESLLRNQEELMFLIGENEVYYSQLIADIHQDLVTVPTENPEPPVHTFSYYSIKMAQVILDHGNMKYVAWLDKMVLSSMLVPMVGVFRDQCVLSKTTFLFAETEESFSYPIWSDENALSLILFTFLQSLLTRSAGGTVELSLQKTAYTQEFILYGTGVLDSDESFGKAMLKVASGSHLTKVEPDVLSKNELSALSMVRELDATITVDENNGTLITVTIPLKHID